MMGLNPSVIVKKDPMLQRNLIQCLQLRVSFYKSNDIYRTDLWVMAEVSERKEGLLPTKAAKEDRGQKKNFSPKKSERNETLGPKKRKTLNGQGYFPDWIFWVLFFIFLFSFIFYKKN